MKLDLSLLSGFRFQCRPGCGLCCYTTPRVARREQSRLIRLDPRVDFGVGPEGGPVISGRPNGGACSLLENNRCRCHAGRPFPCAEFPLTVHVSARAQASVILSCPGVDLDPLLRWAEGAGPSEPWTGLESELAAVKTEIRRLRAREGGRNTGRARHNSDSQWQVLRSGEGDDRIRARLRDRIRIPRPSEYQLTDLPRPEAPVRELPIFFDEVWGRVAWRPCRSGAECFSIKETGGVDHCIGVVPFPRQPPSLEDQARQLLLGYLHYFLARDDLFGVARQRVIDGAGGTLVELVEADLLEVGSQAMARSALRRSLSTQRLGPLSLDDIAAGIRATDLDFLDRPTAGFRL